MPEPLPTAASFAEIAPGIFRWAAFSPFHKVELTSHAVLAESGLLIFDPLPLAEPEAVRRRTGEVQTSLVLTNGNHERAAAAWASLCGAVPVSRVPGLFPAELGVAEWTDQHGWRAVPLAGGAPGETLFLHDGLSLAVFGDAVVNLPERQLELLPDKYCTDPAALRASLKDLPPFERSVFAHGQPLLSGAAAKIAALL
jgi:glyoxylase-like metal-dependent hydrolase (beta-lactamase superfamily II)